MHMVCDIIMKCEASGQRQENMGELTVGLV